MEALVYFAVWAALIFVMMRFGCGAHVLGHGHHHAHRRTRRLRFLVSPFGASQS